MISLMFFFSIHSRRDQGNAVCSCFCSKFSSHIYTCCTNGGFSIYSSSESFAGLLSTTNCSHGKSLVKVCVWNLVVILNSEDASTGLFHYCFVDNPNR